MWPLITVYMHNYLHKSMTLAGFVMLAMSISMIIGNYLGGKLFDGWEPFKTAVLGVSISLSAVFLLIFLNGWPIFAILLVFVAFGDGICLTILNSYAASSSARSSRTIFNLLYIGVNLGIVIGTLLHVTSRILTKVWCFNSLSSSDRILLNIVCHYDYLSQCRCQKD